MYSTTGPKAFRRQPVSTTRESDITRQVDTERPVQKGGQTSRGMTGSTATTKKHEKTMRCRERWARLACYTIRDMDKIVKTKQRLYRWNQNTRIAALVCGEDGQALLAHWPSKRTAKRNKVDENSCVEDEVDFLATRAPTQANPVHHTLGQPTERGVGPPVLVNSPGQRTTYDQYLPNTHVSVLSHKSERKILRVQSKRATNIGVCKAIEVSAANERGEGRRGQEPRVWQRNGSGGKEVSAEKQRDRAVVCGKILPCHY